MTLAQVRELLQKKVRHLEVQRADFASVGDIEAVSRLDEEIETTKQTLSAIGG